MEIEYWEDYYKRWDSPLSPSSFAHFCLERYIREDSTVLELGCGNGRDALFCCDYSKVFYAVDQSSAAIAQIQLQIDQRGLGQKLRLLQADFTVLDFSHLAPIDLFYSRFTLHSVTQSQQDRLLRNILDVISPEARLVIEARTIKDRLYGKGKKVGDHEYFTDHYRRFIDCGAFVTDATLMGFEIDSLVEADNLSVVPNDNPVLMRIALKKRQIDH
jgi:tellurite methyltransferase